MGILGFVNGFAQAYDSSIYETTTTSAYDDAMYDPALYNNATEISTGAAAVAAGTMMVFFAIYMLLAVFMVVCLWKIFTKAGKPGWASLVPFYNIYTELQIVGRPTWWMLLFFIPVANLVVSIILANDLSKAFGKDTGFTVLLILLPIVAYPMLAFGSATYHGPVAAEGGAGAPAPFAPAAASPVAAASPAPAAVAPVGAAPVAQPTENPVAATEQQRPPQAPLVQ